MISISCCTVSAAGAENLWDSDPAGKLDSLKQAPKGPYRGINGFCPVKGVGTDISRRRAVELMALKEYLHLSKLLTPQFLNLKVEDLV